MLTFTVYGVPAITHSRVIRTYKSAHYTNLIAVLSYSPTGLGHSESLSHDLAEKVHK